MVSARLLVFYWVDLQALSSGYLPIGAVLVSPEISEVIHSQSNKLGNVWL